MPIWLETVLAIVAFAIVCLAAVRILAKAHPFPCPFGVGGILENPFRRHLFSAQKTIKWMGVSNGMKVLELGSGVGFLSVEAARKAGDSGKLCCVDIQPEMVKKTRERIQNHNLGNVSFVVADALTLPFKADSFNLAFLVTVLGEIPEPETALRELSRVISPGGILSVGEFLFDPHYCLRGTVKRQANHAGFAFTKESGNFFAYALNFRKVQ